MENSSESLTSKTVKSLSKQTVVTIGMGVLSLMVFAIMSRLLTKEDFGKYAALTAVTTIFSALSEAGMGSALVQYKNPTREYVSTAFNLAIITGIIFTSILLLCAHPLATFIVDESLTTPLRILSISVFFHGLIGVVKANMTRQLQFVRMGYYSAIVYIISAAIAIYMAYVGCGVYAVVVEQVLMATFAFIIYYITLPEKPRWFYISKEYSRQILGYGGWLTASVLFRVFYQQMDKLLMSRWLSVGTLGAYNRPAGFISQISDRLNGIMDTVLFPILSSIQNDKERVVRAYDKILYMCGLYAGILCLLTLYSSNLIIYIFFGEEWHSIAVVFYILVFTLLFSIIGRIMDCLIRSLAYVKAGFYMRVLACFITFGCLYVGKDYDIEGVAVSIVMSNLLIILMKLLYINKQLAISTFHTLMVFFRSQIVVYLPLIVFIFFRTDITYSVSTSIISVSVLFIYIIIVFTCFPNLMGEYLKNFTQTKVKAFRRN